MSAISPELGDLSDDILRIIFELAGSETAWRSLRLCSKRLKAVVERIEWTQLTLSVARVEQLKRLQSLLETRVLVVDRVREFDLHIDDSFWPQQTISMYDVAAAYVAAFVRGVAERAPGLVDVRVGELWADRRIASVLEALQPASDRLEARALGLSAFSERALAMGAAAGYKSVYDATARKAVAAALRFPRLQSFCSRSGIFSPGSVAATFPGLRRVELAVNFRSIDEALGAFAACAAIEDLTLWESDDHPARDHPVGGYGLRRLAAGPAASSLLSLRLRNMQLPGDRTYQPVRLAAEAVRALPLFPKLQRLSGPLEIGRTAPRDAIAALAAAPSVEHAELAFRVASLGAAGAEQLLGLAALVRSAPSLRSLRLLLKCDAETQLRALEELADAARGRGAPALRIAAELSLELRIDPYASAAGAVARLRCWRDQFRASLPSGFELQTKPQASTVPPAPAPPAPSQSAPLFPSHGKRAFPDVSPWFSSGRPRNS
eukprot:tig00020710_g13323.t1